MVVVRVSGGGRVEGDNTCKLQVPLKKSDKYRAFGNQSRNNACEKFPGGMEKLEPFAHDICKSKN